MDLYTLTPGFLRDDVIDEFESCIWTERYSKSGDINLIVDATSKSLQKLKEGTFIALGGSNEIMMIETQAIENGLLTVTGPSIIQFLNNRLIRNSYSQSARSWTTVVAAKPGQFINLIVELMLVDGGFVDESTPNGLDGTQERFPNLSMGAWDPSGDAVLFDVPFGGVYDGIAQIADTFSVGMSMYLDSADDSGYSLKFKTYKGIDRTSDQSVVDIVRFSPSMDSLTNIKELHSIATYKNVCYAFAPGNAAFNGQTVGPAYAPGYNPISDLGFSRRSMMIFVDDVNTELPEGADAAAWWNAYIAPVLVQRQKDALANNNYTKIVDGEVIPQQHTYGVDYDLGDIVELEGYSGALQKARITEFIRTEDSTGVKSYPTVSVIE